ncbi:hypothetical protein NL676_038481 [Syzygium grande]|nr:hypothetical protein NL676_038481 [Syzygium grande]
MVSSLLLSNQSPLGVFLFFSLLLVDTTSLHGAGVSASSTSFFTIKATENKDEAAALLNWKSTLENHSQSLLSSWLGNNPCGFTGVTCDDYGAITHLNLAHFGLRGTLDGLDFSSLTNMAGFELGNNLISGSIPSSIGNLSKLNSLHLCGNELSGDIPPSMELAYSTIPTEKCDVYSFGVIALETIMDPGQDWATELGLATGEARLAMIDEGQLVRLPEAARIWTTELAAMASIMGAALELTAGRDPATESSPPWRKHYGRAQEIWHGQLMFDGEQVDLVSVVLT